MDKEWVEHLSNRMREAVMTRIPEVTLNGDADKRYPGNLNFSFAYVEVRCRCCLLLVVIVRMLCCCRRCCHIFVSLSRELLCGWSQKP